MLSNNFGSGPRIVFFSSFSNLIWPPRCLVTKNPISQPGQLCAEAWSKLDFIEAPCCVQCGFPFELSYGETERLCLGCDAVKPQFDAARAAFIYNEHSRKLILDFKHGGWFEALPFFTKQLHRLLGQLPEAPDLILPVPLHPRRLLKRKFNQSAILAREFSKGVKLQLLLNQLRRVKATASQEGKNFVQRRANVAGAFRVSSPEKSVAKRYC